MRRAIVTLVCGCAVAGLLAPATAWARYGDGSIVGWGTQVVGGDLSADFVAVAAAGYHSLGLKTDGSIVPWGINNYGQCNVPAPNTDFVAVAAGYCHSLGRRADGSIVGAVRLLFGSAWETGCPSRRRFLVEFVSRVF